MRTPSTRPSVLIHDLELLHAGLGVLMAHYRACIDDGVRLCLALRISRQLRLIAEHPEVPDWGLRTLYRTMAARWQVRAVEARPIPKRPTNPHSNPRATVFEEAV